MQITNTRKGEIPVFALSLFRVFVIDFLIAFSFPQRYSWPKRKALANLIFGGTDHAKRERTACQRRQARH